MWRIKKRETQGEEPGLKSPQTNQVNQTPMATPGCEEGANTVNKIFMRPAEAVSDRATTRLGSSVHVKGDIHANEDLYIDGGVEGLVHLDGGNLTVGKAARLTANLIAEQVVVYGSVKGNVRASRIEIKKDGSVIGDLTTPQILIEDGAYFKGSIEIDSGANKKAEKGSSPHTESTGAQSAAAGTATTRT